MVVLGCVEQCKYERSGNLDGEDRKEKDEEDAEVRKGSLSSR